MSWDWFGSKWWKFDFHNHTPASDDYGKGHDQAQHKQISHRDWLLNYMRQGIDCVAVTDHNSGAWIDPLKQALQELESEGHADYRPLYLFGVLGIFPRKRTKASVAPAIPGLPDGVTSHFLTVLEYFG